MKTGQESKACYMDRSTISIWQDKWIRYTISMTPIFKPENMTLQHVNELIDQESWTWRHALVRGTFLAPDAEAILNIPLRIGGGEDFQAWAFESTGNYSVKSAYRTLVTHKEWLA